MSAVQYYEESSFDQETNVEVDITIWVKIPKDSPYTFIHDDVAQTAAERAIVWAMEEGVEYNG